MSGRSQMASIVVQLRGIAAVGLIGTVVITGCGSSNAQPTPSIAGSSPAPVPASATGSPAVRFDGQTLTVTSNNAGLTDGFKAGVGKVFEETTGGKIQWVAIPPATATAQLIASGGAAPPYDVVLLDTATQATAVQAGVLTPMNYERVPNVKKLPATASGAAGYSPGLWYFALGFCYNTARYSAAGITPPSSLESLFDPKVAGRVSLPDVTFQNWQLGMPALAPAFGNTLSDPRPTIDRLKQISGVRLLASAAEHDQALQSGDVWLALYGDGRCNGLQAQGTPVKFTPLGLSIQGKTYDYIVATGGNFDIAKGTTKLAMAEKFIDMAHTVDGIVPLTSKLVYTPTLPAAAAAMNADPKLSPYLLKSTDRFYTADYVDFLKYMKSWVDAWNRAFKG